jgi:hypothetical protein
MIAAAVQRVPRPTFSSTFFWIWIDFADDREQVSSICLVHNPKNAIPAGVRLKHVVSVRGMKQDFDAGRR